MTFTQAPEQATGPSRTARINELRDLAAVLSVATIHQGEYSRERPLQGHEDRGVTQIARRHERTTARTNLDIGTRRAARICTDTFVTASQGARSCDMAAMGRRRECRTMSNKDLDRWS